MADVSPQALQPAFGDCGVVGALSQVTPRSESGSDDADWHLLASARNERRSLEILFERHRDFVFRVAWGLVGEHTAAEDVTQEVFLRLLESRRRWRRRARFRTFVYGVTLNVSREQQRRGARESPAHDEAIEALTPPVEPPAVGELRDLSKALGRLSRRQREVVVLRCLEGLSTREAAQAMKCREGTVKIHLHRGLAALRQALE